MISMIELVSFFLFNDMKYHSPFAGCEIQLLAHGLSMLALPVLHTHVPAIFL